MYRDEIMEHARSRFAKCRDEDFEFVRKLVERYEYATPENADAVAKKLTSGIIT
jgi:hypothetical protein